MATHNPITGTATNHTAVDQNGSPVNNANLEKGHHGNTHFPDHGGAPIGFREQLPARSSH